jgi:hypothetical protein
MNKQTMPWQEVCRQMHPKRLIDMRSMDVIESTPRPWDYFLWRYGRQLPKAKDSIRILFAF